MQKNDKSYAFLLSHKTKKGIYIKRVAVPKSHVHFGAVGIFLLLGISVVGIGIGGVLKNTALAASLAKTQVSTQIKTEAITPETPENTTQQIDYSRPSSPDFSFNSGGPLDDASLSSDDKELDEQLRSIQANVNPAYLPTMWSHLGKINNEFGFRRNPFGGRSYEFHPGMDIDGERGDLVVAPANGTVISAGYKGGYGNMIEIDHGNGLTTRYGHLSKIESAAGDTITRGQLIGYVGSTGRSTGPHLHYELRLDERPINPRHFLPPEPMDLAKLER